MLATFLIQRFRRSALCNASLRELRRLTDRELDDLGLARSQLEPLGRSREDG